jgi:hypothetical protein
MRPRAAVVMPLPTELTTPPVTKMYLGICSSGAGGRHQRKSGTRPEAPPTSNIASRQVILKPDLPLSTQLFARRCPER